MSGPGTDPPKDAFDRLLADLRPKLHRYCARMTGSVIEGEDVLQDALVKAIEAFPQAGPIRDPEGWLFRIAHNAALDFLRGRARRNNLVFEEDAAMLPDPSDVIAAREAAAASLRAFMHLPPAQRASVILMDVLGYSLTEIEQITTMSMAAVKASLHRGRAGLREAAARTEVATPPQLGARERDLLRAYTERFNARDVDGFRALLAEDVQLELVSRLRRRGRTEVGTYFGRYGTLTDWRLVPGLVEGRPAALVVDPADAASRPVYFVLLAFEGAEVATIIDFRFARYVMDGAEVTAF